MNLKVHKYKFIEFDDWIKEFQFMTLYCKLKSSGYYEIEMFDKSDTLIAVGSSYGSPLEALESMAFNISGLTVKIDGTLVLIPDLIIRNKELYKFETE